MSTESDFAAFRKVTGEKFDELRTQLTNESVVNAQLLKKINDLAWQIVRLKADNEATSQVRCNAIVESEKDTERLDWLDRNMTARDSFQIFEKEVLIGELRQAIDAAMRKEAQP